MCRTSVQKWCIVWANTKSIVISSKKLTTRDVDYNCKEEGFTEVHEIIERFTLFVKNYADVEKIEFSQIRFPDLSDDGRP
jgi:hypothetical protein